MPLIFPSNTLSAAGFSVDNSCRFNRADTPVLTRTHGTPTLGTKFTWSGWVKRSRLGADQYFAMHWQDSSDYGYFYFRTGDDIRFFDRHTGDSDTVWISNSLFRDYSAWYHIFIKCDTTQATDTNRFKVFINGVQDTGNGITYPAQDAEMAFSKASDTDRISIGGSGDGSNHMGGYFSEVAFMDGTAYDHTDLGEFDEDSPTIWKPKDPSTLTFGDNGYYLDFEDSANLGDDESGNASDFTETNIDATDQATDTPTNNFCTLNPLIPTTEITFSEGNCKIVTHASSDNYGAGVGTFGLTAGKWYWEIKMASLLGNNTHGVISELTAELCQDVAGLQNDVGVTVFRNDDGGEMVKDGTETTADYGTLDDGDILGIAFNADDNEISIYDNGALIVDGYTISTTRGTIFPLVKTGINTTSAVNFGGCSSFTVSSANQDANGYGNFEIAPPSGYLALCSKNLGSDGG